MVTIISKEGTMPLSAPDRRALDEDGYLVLTAVLPGVLLARLCRRVGEVFAQEGNAAGAEFKPEPGCRRLASLVDKGAVFRAVIAHPRVLACARHVLGPDLKLSSLNVRSADPGVGARPLHADMAALPHARGYSVCNTIRMLDACTPDNGALRLVPGSRRRGRLPRQALADPPADHLDQVQVTGRAGTVVVLNAHARHACTANPTGLPRAALHAFSCRRDRPRQQGQKRLLRPEVQRSLPPELGELVALEDPLNDRLGAAAARSGFLK
jgi:hypothetical protein